jgi:hypothetical protein
VLGPAQNRAATGAGPTLVDRYFCGTAIDFNLLNTSGQELIQIDRLVPIGFFAWRRGFVEHDPINCDLQGAGILAVRASRHCKVIVFVPRIARPPDRY